MKDRFLDLFWPCLFAVRNFPFHVLFELFFLLLLAATPAFNVYLISMIGKQLDLGQPITVPLMLLAVLFGGSNLFLQLRLYAGRIHAYLLMSQCKIALNEKLRNFQAYHYNDTDRLEELRVARESFSQGHVSNQYQALLTMGSALVSAGLLYFALYNINVKVALLSLALPVVVLIGNRYYGSVFNNSHKTIMLIERRNDYLYNLMDRDRSGFELATMKSGGEVAKLIALSVSCLNRIKQMRLIKTGLSEVATSLGSTAVFGYAVYILMSESDLTSLLAGILGLLAAFNAFVEVGYHLGSIARSKPANRSLRKFLAQPLQPVTKHSLTEVTKLEVVNANVHYNTKQAVKNVNLTLERNKLVALVGHNGCGKTSLFKAMMGTQGNATGQLRFNDTTLDLSQANEAIAYATVNQEFQKYDVTIREFVTLGLEQQVTDEQIWQALEKVEFADYVRNLEKGLDTFAGVQWGGIDLSGGQWQRLCIARGLLSDKGLLFLDEPTSAIDAQTEERIFGHLAHLAKDKLVLLTTHRVATLKDADCIYVMEQGEIVEQGSFNELNRAGTKFRDLFESQFINQAQNTDATDNADVEQVAVTVAS